MDERLALRIAFEGHRSGATPAAEAVGCGWRSLVITPPHDAGTFAPQAVASLRSLTPDGVRLVWDGRGTGSWVDVGRARIGALERARLQVQRAADVGAATVVVGCGERDAAQPLDARWDQMAAGLAELAYEAERAGVELALETLPTPALADLDVEARVVVDHEVTAGVRLGLDHSGWLAEQAVPEPWWPNVAWIRLPAPPAGTWPAASAAITADARRAAGTFSAAVVEFAVWGWEHQDLPLPVHRRHAASES